PIKIASGGRFQDFRIPDRILTYRLNGFIGMHAEVVVSYPFSMFVHAEHGRVFSEKSPGKQVPKRMEFVFDFDPMCFAFFEKFLSALRLDEFLHLAGGNMRSQRG